MEIKVVVGECTWEGKFKEERKRKAKEEQTRLDSLPETFSKGPVFSALDPEPNLKPIPQIKVCTITPNQLPSSRDFI